MINKLLPKLAGNSTWGGYAMGEGDSFRDGNMIIKIKNGYTLVRISRGD